MTTPLLVSMFAERWIADWNRRDVEAVLAHFADDATFVSPLALAYTGRAVLRGKPEIRAYWLAALSRIHTLDFKLIHAVWCDWCRELAVIYVATLNGERRRACEVMTFNEAGRQIRGEAIYGSSVLPSDRLEHGLC